MLPKLNSWLATQRFENIGDLKAGGEWLAKVSAEEFYSDGITNS